MSRTFAAVAPGAGWVGLRRLGGWVLAGAASVGMAQTAPPPLPCDAAGLRPEALRRINEWRAAGAQCGGEGHFGPAPPLQWNDALERAAVQHSRDMAAQDYMEHEGRAGDTPATRVDAQGYVWSLVAENIAAGQPTLTDVLDSWRRSPGHCANVMKPGLHEVGLACVRATGGRYATYWTLVLAAPLAPPRRP